MSDFDLSNYPVLPAEPTGELREQLGRVKYVFTDLDATMLAPGSCALSDNEGNPSTALVEAIVALKRAGIEIIPCSGRARVMMHEDSRILGFNSYIGEMGGLLMLDLRANEWEYFTGDMPYDPDCGLTPHQVIEQAGVCQGIIDRWPGRIEYHNDMANGIKYREVTVGMRGEVPDEEAQAMIDVAGLGLVWGNNGYLTPEALWNTRTPAGHPEGFIEAFANIYRNFSLTVRAIKNGETPSGDCLDFPTVYDGVRGMQFIETMVEAGYNDNVKWQKWID